MNKYKTATAFLMALSDRLKNKSKDEKVDIQRLRRQVAFDRLLARLFHIEPSPWVLKGGYAMELRVSHPRATKDVDLAMRTGFFETLPSEDPNMTILKELRTRGSEDLNDFFIFQISEPIMGLEAAPYGGARFSVEALVDGRLFSKFHLDVGLGDDLIEPVDIVIGEDWLDFADLHTKGIPALSVNQQFAEKLHTYTLPREGRKNSRVKDLVDMTLLLRSGKLKKEKVIEAIERTFKRRATHEIPHKLLSPPSEWKEPFSRLARDCELTLSSEDAFRELNLYFSDLFT